MKYENGRPWPLGASRDQDGWNFAVSSDESVNLILFQDDKSLSLPMKKTLGQVYAVRVKEHLSDNVKYMFETKGKLFADPAGRDVRKPGAFAEKIPASQIRCALPDVLSPAVLKRNVNGAAVCLHVRGFTKCASSGVSSPGTFEGAAEKFPFLKSLGFEEVILLPIYDFFERRGGKTNYWGYGGGNFFSPNSHLAGSASGRKSFHALVKAAEKCGLALTLYMPFSADVGTLKARECLLSYRTDYGIRDFILNPQNVNLAVLKEDPRFADMRLETLDDRFMYTVRQFLRGDAGFALLGGKAFSESGLHYVARHTGFTLRDLYMFERKHNEMNGEGNFDGPEEDFGCNCGVEGPSEEENIRTLRRQLIRNAAFITLLSRGRPVMTAEDVLMHSRKGNNNPYCQDNFLTRPDWEKKDEDFLAYIRALMDFRSRHLLLREEDAAPLGSVPVSFHGESAWMSPAHRYERGVGVMYAGERESLLVLMNPWGEPFEAGLPSAPFGPWKKRFSSVCGTVDHGETYKGIRKTVAPWEMEILVSEKRG